MSSEKKEDLPTLLVIASTTEEDWVKLCSKYSSKFKVIQTTWEKSPFHLIAIQNTQ